MKILKLFAFFLLSFSLQTIAADRTVMVNSTNGVISYPVGFFGSNLQSIVRLNTNNMSTNLFSGIVTNLAPSGKTNLIYYTRGLVSSVSVIP